MEVMKMDYEKATNYLENDIDVCKLTILCSLIVDDNTTKGMNYIQEITKCDEQTSKLLWCDMKMKYGTPDTNPIFRAREKYKAEEASKKVAEDYQYRNNAECPYCHSKNTKKISGISKAGSVALLGVFAVGKVGKQWHCNNCKSDF